LLSFSSGLIGKGDVVHDHSDDVACFCKCCCPLEFPIVPHVVGKRATFPFAPGKFHAATVEGGLCAGGDHRCFRGRNAGVLGERLTLLLFACVDSKWEGRCDASDKFCHVVVNVRLGYCCICAANVSDDVATGDCVETFGGVIKFCIINIVNGHRKLVMCDGVGDDVCVPRLAFGKVGSSSSFTSRISDGWIDGVFRRRRAGNCG
jgi:hypothetical protein